MKGAKIQAVGTADGADRLHVVARRGSAPARRLGRSAPRRQRAEQPLRRRQRRGHGHGRQHRRRRQELHGAVQRRQRRRRTTRARCSTCASSSPASPRSRIRSSTPSPSARSAPARARRISSRSTASMTRTSSSAAASTSITSIAFETADDMFDMSEGWSGRMQYLDRHQHGAAHAAHRRRLLLGGPRGHRERRLQRHGLRPRLQLGAVHHSARRELHAHRLRSGSRAWARAAATA